MSFSSFIQLLKNPWVVLLSIALAIVSGIYFPELSISSGTLGSIYITLLQMTVIPLLLTAVVSSLGRLIATHGLTKRLSKIVLFFIFSLTVASTLGIFAGFVGAPGKSISESGRNAIGAYLNAGDTADAPSSDDQQWGPLKIFKNMIPSNPFASLGDGDHLAVLFFSILLGLALGFVDAQSREVALVGLEAMYAALLRIIDWTLYLLPFGMFCIFSSQIAQLGFDLISAMSNFIFTTLLVVLFMLTLYVLILWRQSKKPLRSVLYAIRQPFFVAFATHSSFATIPSIILSLEKHFSKSRNDINLVVPLSVNLNRQGTTMYMALATVFVHQLYQIDFTFGAIVQLLVMGLICGMVPAGIIALVPLIFTPFNLPPEVGVVLLLAVDAIVDPFLTTANVLGFFVTTHALSEHDSSAPAEATA